MRPRRPRTSRWWKGLVWAGLGLTVFLLVVNPARADVAPPERPPGTNPLPGSETTHVRMVAETVVLDVQRRSADGGEGEARVQADFLMRNLGAVEERLEVRFPLSFWNGASNGWGNFPELHDLKVLVEGASASTHRVMMAVTGGSAERAEMPWAVFPVVFAPGEDVRIRVSYTADGSGEAAFVAFKYILETGAGWYGTIGSADLIIRLPYEVSAQNVIFDEQTGYSTTTPGGVIEGRQVRWHYDDLEPTYEHNLEVSLVKPEVWEQALLEKEKVRLEAEDGEAWGRLGKAYKEMIRFRRGYRQDAGGLELFRLSFEAYEKAVTLLPQDALWHFGFADLLFGHYYWHVYLGGSTELSEILRAAEEISLAYTLNPDDERILSLIEEIKYSLPGAVEQTEGGYEFPILTATPAPGSSFFPLRLVTPTSPPPATPFHTEGAATALPEPTRTPSPTPMATDAARPSSRPFCGVGSIGLLLFAAVPFLRAVRPGGGKRRA